MKSYCTILMTSILFIVLGNQNTQAQDSLNYFITTWKTDNPGPTNNTSISIPTHPGTTYSYDVDWENDGTFDDFDVTGNISHDYGKIDNLSDSNSWYLSKEYHASIAIYSWEYIIITCPKLTFIDQNTC